MAESHTEGIKEGQFCAVRADKCDCGNEYVKNCEPSEDWGKYPQRYTTTTKDKVTKQITSKTLDARRRAHEAHHIACVASVTGIIGKNDDIRSVVHNTKWCINHKQNMIALPLWAHTIEWYCRLSRASPLRPEILSQVAHGKFVVTSAPSPPFANLPQHDYDHAAYIDEVDTALNRIVDEVQKLTGQHKAQEKTLKKELNSLVNKQKLELQNRGQRCGGTHAAWSMGMNFHDSEWYLPFSMAAASKADKRTFPMSDMSDKGTIAQKILEVAEAFWAEGAAIPVPF